MHAATLFETLWQDLRFGARTLFKNPGFAAIAILTLALGIGANAAIFSVINAVLLRPLPWSQPDRAVMIWSRWTAFDKTWVATGEVLDYRRRAKTLSDVAAWGEGQVNLTGDGDPERLAAANVTANLFSTLGVAPLIGRTFTAQEDRAERSVAGRPRLQPVEPSLRRRSVDRRSIRPDRRRCVRGHRRHAPGFRAADGLPQSRAQPALGADADGSGIDGSREPRALRDRAPRRRAPRCDRRRTSSTGSLAR